MRWPLQFTLGGLMALAAFLAYHFTPTQRMAVLEPINLQQAVPTAFADWRDERNNTGIITSADRTATLQSIYAQVLDRVYVNAQGERVMLSVAYTEDQSDNSGKQSHRPEICYPAQGFHLLSAASGALGTSYGSIPVQRLVAESGTRTEPLTYWTTIGDTVPGDALKTHMAQLRYGFSGRVPDGVVFRVSSVTADTARAYALQAQFVQALLAAMTPAARHRLAGLAAVAA